LGQPFALAWATCNGYQTGKLISRVAIALTGLPGLSGLFASDGVYTFRVRAVDGVGNASGWVESAPVSVTLVKKYYAFGGKRVAMRADGVVYYIHTDHLGSTSLVTNQGQGVVAQQGYYPYGAPRWNVGTLPTDFTFTGQRENDSTGLMFYRARYYSPQLARFLSADTIVPSPGNPQSLNRYAYALNNPVRYRDPSGHWVETAFDIISLGMTLNDIRNEGFTFWNTVSLATDVASIVLPMVPAGASHAIRAAKWANKAINAVDTVHDVANVADAAIDAAKAVNAVDNAADAISTVTKADIIADLSNGTTQSQRIAQAMERGRIRVNILGDEMFDKAYRYYGGTGNPSDVAAFARRRQTYLRQSSDDIFRDAVHEGTHALDNANNFKGTSYLREKRAYFYERQFQLRKGRYTEFRDLRDIRKHVYDNY